MKKLKSIFAKFNQKALKVTVLSMTALATAIPVAFADATTPVSLLDGTAKGLVDDFAADIVPTYAEILIIGIGATITLWAMSAPIKKAIGWIKSAFRKA